MILYVFVLFEDLSVGKCYKVRPVLMQVRHRLTVVVLYFFITNVELQSQPLSKVCEKISIQTKFLWICDTKHFIEKQVDLTLKVLRGWVKQFSVFLSALVKL